MGKLKAKWREKRPEIISGGLYRFVRTLISSVRITEVNKPESFDKSICCGWHGKSVMFAFRHKNKGFYVLISQSRDGDIQNEIFTRLGYKTIRGSTARDGARAAVEAIKVLRKGGTMAMTPDGPRGPSGIVQGGVMTMAQKSGAALVPVGLSARPRWIIPTWDNYMIPYPGAKGIIVYGEPIFVPKEATEEEVEVIRLQLQDAINLVEAEADKLMGYK